MLEMLLNFIFTIVTNVSQAIMTPITNVLFVLFPDLTTVMNNIISWLFMSFEYLTCVYRWLLFTPAMFVALFDFFALRFIIFLTSSAIRAGAKLWNLFKL